MKVPTITTVRCSNCTWQPDPTRRMSADNQAAEHTKTMRHTTTTSTQPVRGVPASTANRQRFTPRQ